MMNVEAARLKAAIQHSTRVANQDRRRINMAYIHMHDALDELLQVTAKDNILAHMTRTLGALEDTLYEYVTTKRRDK